MDAEGKHHHHHHRNHHAPAKATPVTHKGWFARYVLGSSFRAALPETAIMTAIGAAWCVLFCGVVEDLEPPVFPIDSRPLDNIAYFIGTFLVGYYATLGRDTYNNVFGAFSAVSGAVFGFAITYNAYLDPVVAPSSDSEPRLARRREVYELLGAVPVAVQNQYRTPGKTPEADSKLRPAQLPMSDALQRELAGYVPPYTGGLAHMLTVRVAEDLRAGDIGGDAVQVLQGYTDSIIGSLGAMDAVKAIGLTPVLTGITCTAVYIYCALQPWTLWHYYRWYTVPVNGVCCWILLAMLRAGNVLSNPFDPYESSSYIFTDVGAMVQGVRARIESVSTASERRSADSWSARASSSTTATSNIFAPRGSLSTFGQGASSSLKRRASQGAAGGGDDLTSSASSISCGVSGLLSATAPFDAGDDSGVVVVNPLRSSGSHARAVRFYDTMYRHVGDGGQPLSPSTSPALLTTIPEDEVADQSSSPNLPTSSTW